MIETLTATDLIVDEIGAERRRQVEKEGWTAKHDDHYNKGEMALAAACYASPERVFIAEERVGRGYEAWTVYADAWPWRDEWWKPKDRRRDLIRAAALIVAEIERLDRAKASTPPPVQRSPRNYTKTLPSIKRRQPRIT